MGDLCHGSITPLHWYDLLKQWLRFIRWFWLYFGPVITSSAVLSNSFLNIGIEKLTGGKKAFINFTRNLLLKQVPCLFSPKFLFSELLETIEPDKEVITAVTQMHQKGCHFALDDFIFHEKFEPLINTLTPLHGQIHFAANSDE